MSRDNPIIERIRKTRRAISAETGNDLERLGAYYQELQRTTFADRKLRPDTSAQEPEASVVGIYANAFRIASAPQA